MEKVISLITGLKSTLISIAIAALVLFGVYEFGHYKGVTDQKLKTATAETVAITKGVQGRGKVEQEVNKLSDPDLDGELAHWMRD